MKIYVNARKLYTGVFCYSFRWISFMSCKLVIMEALCRIIVILMRNVSKTCTSLKSEKYFKMIKYFFRIISKEILLGCNETWNYSFSNLMSTLHFKNFKTTFTTCKFTYVSSFKNVRSIYELCNIVEEVSVHESKKLKP